MSISPQKLVIALGGNAISVPGEQGTIEEQFMHTRQTAVFLADAILAGYQPIITHGNGPQVGNILRRVELAKHELYTIPLEVCVADTQAGMGYMIGQCLMNELAARHHGARGSGRSRVSEAIETDWAEAGKERCRATTR
jgi:carbamate kinase